MFFKKNFKLYALPFLLSGFCHAQFLDHFDKNKIEGWFTMIGDGTPGMEFKQNNGYATMVVDGTKDKYNVYWTLIKRNISSSLDLNKFKDPANQLRVEAKVRVHNAPRRVNFMVNTDRTTDYDKDLMEFDIPDTTDWHVISMTTKNFDVLPCDSLYVQLCVTDYGLEKYYVDIDYYRADIVNIHTAGPDKGELVPYHPAIPKIITFKNHLNVSQDALINSDFPDVNFNNWKVKEKEGESQTLTINNNQWAILRWDFNSYKNQKAEGAGILELTTQSFPKGGKYIEAYGEDFGIEFGKVRIIEIFGGDPAWDQNTVTYSSLIQDKKYSDIFNTQMTYDLDVNETPGGKNYVTISKPVLQRLIDGKTKGLLIRPLGAVDASFYASENKAGNGPVLYFNIEK